MFFNWHLIMANYYIVVNSRCFSANGALEFNELCSVAFPVNEFTRFSKHIVQHALTIPPNSEPTTIPSHMALPLDLPRFHICFSYTQDCRSDLIFHQKSQSDAKMTLFCSSRHISALQNHFQGILASIHMASNFSMYSVASKRFKTAA